MKPSASKREFIKAITSMTHRHPIWRVFSDFCEMSAISFSNAFLKDETREKRYLEILAAYEPDEQKQFPCLLGQTIDGLEDMDCDFLGECFMEMELGSHWKGQFFTPFHLCQAMAGLTVGDDPLQGKEFITVHEPACGAGATIIGLAAALRAKGINYQKTMHVTAIDVDTTAAHMCFIQLSLLHVPAIVVIGNTLSMEMRSQWLTPAHHMGLWDWKLRRRNEPSGAPAPIQPIPVVANNQPSGQLSFDLNLEPLKKRAG